MYSNLGFCILSPEHNLGRFQSTFYSIRKFFTTAEITCAVQENTHNDEIKETKNLLPNVYKGGDSIISMLNTALKKSKSQYNMILIEGVIFRNLPLQKYILLSDNNTVIYPVSASKDTRGNYIKIYNQFLEGPFMLNGLLLHKDVFKLVGEFPETNIYDKDKAKLTFNESCVTWGCKAKELGVNLKGIVGAKLA